VCFLVDGSHVHTNPFLTFAGISDGNMAEGSMRCDVNISVSGVGVTKELQMTQVGVTNDPNGQIYSFQKVAGIYKL
jgi:Asp-tRNA(Asn)/Glu-tRNA(Gln) amidotransferase B subunit